jgi:hypothetical protein
MQFSCLLQVGSSITGIRPVTTFLPRSLGRPSCRLGYAEV